MNISRKYFAIVALVMLCAVALPSCSTSSRSTVTSEVTTTEGARSGEAGTTRTVEVTKETHDQPSEHRGFFGILGDIIALPFRAVGALLTAIF